MSLNALKKGTTLGNWCLTQGGRTELDPATLSQARLYDFERVKRAYGKLLETDLAIKTGQYNDKLALELLVTDLACLNP